METFSRQAFGFGNFQNYRWGQGIVWLFIRNGGKP